MRNQNSSPPDRARQTWVPTLVLLAALIFTAVAAHYVSLTTRVKNQQRFNHVVQQATDMIEDRLDNYIALLRGANGLFSASDRVTLRDFRAYVEALNLARRYPGIQGIGFSKHLKPQEVQPTEAALRAAGQPSFHVWPGDPRPDYHTIVYLEPLDRRNRQAIGYDMSTESARRAAMERARDTGEAAASGKVILVQEIDEHKQAGFLIYVPVYEGGKAPASVAERRATLDGFVYAPFRADDLFLGIFGRQTRPLLAFQVFDGNSTRTANLLHTTPGSSGVDHPSFKTTKRVTVAGRLWTLSLTSTPAFDHESGFNFAPIVLVGGGLISVLLFGVTQAQVRSRQAAERYADHLRQNEQTHALLAAIVASSDDAIEGKDLDGTILSWNDGAQTMFGYSAEEMIGRTDRVLLPGDRPHEERRILEKIRAGQPVKQWETVRIHKSGRLIQVSLTVSPIRNSAGEIIGMSSISRDITDRKEAEAKIRKLNSELERRVAKRTAELENALKELESFSYSVSHDLRAPLRHICGYVEAIQQDASPPLNPACQRYLSTVSAAATRMGNLIDDLLSFSHMGRAEMDKTVFSLEGLVQSCLQDLQREMQGRQVEWVISSLPKIYGDPSLLRVALVNLLMNALKYTRPCNPARIEVGALTGTEGETIVFVRDNGVGFDMKYAEKLFKVFQRLHREQEFEGTGIGLANVQRIIQRHGGRVWADSRPGEGATFFFSLPDNSTTT